MSEAKTATTSPGDEREREAFETYYAKFGRVMGSGRFVQYIDPDDDTLTHYADPLVGEAWHIWQAARASSSTVIPADKYRAMLADALSSSTVQQVGAERPAMNPHADSVQQPSDSYLIGVLESHHSNNLSTEDALKCIRFGTRPAAEPVSDIVKLQIEIDEASQSAGEAESYDAASLYCWNAPTQAPSGQQAEPTDAMLNAARDWSKAKYGIPIGNDAAIGCWKAMYAALAGQQSERPAPAGLAELLARATKLANAGWTDVGVSVNSLQTVLREVLAALASQAERPAVKEGDKP